MLRRILYGLCMLMLIPQVVWAHQEGGPMTHHEAIYVGPYMVHVEFQEWPVKAMKSQDILFSPVDGIQGKSGTYQLEQQDPQKLSRHARFPASWGLEAFAFDQPGEQTIVFEIDGNQGKATGKFTFMAEEPPATLPMSFHWLLGFMPLVGLLVFIVIEWRRVNKLKVMSTQTRS